MSTTDAFPHPGQPQALAQTGVPGLDDVLGGGLARGRTCLLEGNPGTGKTTIGLQFLRAGASMGERGLYVTLAETAEELRATAASHGWMDVVEPLITIDELAPAEALLDEESRQSLLHSSDLELGEAARALFAAIVRVRPQRVVIDSLSEIRLLAESSLRYRRQVLAMKHFFARHAVTVLLLDDLTAEAAARSTHSIAHGVIRLDELAPAFGAERRRLRVAKYRGQRFRGGFHDFAIATGGVCVFPRLVAAEHRRGFARGRVTTGLPGLDRLLGGGIERGTATLCIGPTGAGKSLLALRVAAAAVARGERAAVFVFDEEVGLLTERTRALGLDVAAMTASGLLTLDQVDAAEMPPGEFAALVRRRVQDGGAEGEGDCTVVIDSLNGYQNAMPDERDLVLHMHELLQLLNRLGAVTVVTVAQHGLMGDMRAPVDVTYLADAVVLLRYFEAAGRVRRALSVLKKRGGWHEETIREYRLTPQHVFEIGEPLTGFQGVLRGTPVFAGQPAGLLGFADPGGSPDSPFANGPDGGAGAAP